MPTPPLAPRPHTPVLPLGAAPPAALKKVQMAIAPLSADLSLYRLSQKERGGLGRTHGLFQVRKSLACLRLLGKRPDLAARLQRTSPAAWQALVDLRLSVAQARNALDATTKAVARGELLLLSQITVENDTIEDHLLAWMTRPGVSAEEKRRLGAKFSDPAGVRTSFEEFVALRRDRRSRRDARNAEVLGEAEARLARSRGLDRLARAEGPPAPRNKARRTTKR